jgi:RHS repeat-associated protein
LRFVGDSGVLESYAYDEFGCDTLGNQGQLQPFGYTGYQYDTIAQTYFAQAREYVPGVGRFAATDIVKGTISAPLTMNEYSYCLNSPVQFLDPSGQTFKEATRELARRIIANPAFSWITKNGLLPRPFGFVRTEDLNGKNVYHATMDCYQQYGGFNDFYDTVFDHATSMNKAKFRFTSGGQEYVLWAWKGDYLNLGAGAEMGIYKQLTLMCSQQHRINICLLSLIMTRILSIQTMLDSIRSLLAKKLKKKSTIHIGKKLW